MHLRDHADTLYVAHFDYGAWDGRRTTNCILHVGYCEKIQEAGTCKSDPRGHGHAACSKKDEFKKFTGRKIALARAMQLLKLSKPIRTSLWQHYLSISHP